MNGGIKAPVGTNITLVNGPGGMTAVVTNGAIRIADPSPSSWYEITFGVSTGTNGGLFQLYSSLTNANNSSYTPIANTVLDISDNLDLISLKVIINITNNPTYIELRNIFDKTIELDCNHATDTFDGHDAKPITAYVTIDKLR